MKKILTSILCLGMFYVLAMGPIGCGGGTEKKKETTTTTTTTGEKDKKPG